MSDCFVVPIYRWVEFSAENIARGLADHGLIPHPKYIVGYAGHMPDLTKVQLGPYYKIEIQSSPASNLSSLGLLVGLVTRLTTDENIIVADLIDTSPRWINIARAFMSTSNPAHIVLPFELHLGALEPTFYHSLNFAFKRWVYELLNGFGIDTRHRASEEHAANVFDLYKFAVNARVFGNAKAEYILARGFAGLNVPKIDYTPFINEYSVNQQRVVFDIEEIK